MVTLFSPDRPDEGFMEWYADRKSRCIQQMWEVTCELLNNDISAILELGLVQRADREDFYHRIDAADYDTRMYVLDTPLETRRQRVRERNERRAGTFRMEVSGEMFELANSFWEAPDEIECEERKIEIVDPIQSADGAITTR